MSMHTETRHIEKRAPGIRQEKEITTTTIVEPGTKGSNKTYAEAAGATHSPSHKSKSSSRRASFSQQAQQLIPNVSKQQLAYGLPVVLAILLSLLFLGFKDSISSYFQPPPPPTMTQQFAHKLDSWGSNLGGDYWESLKTKTGSLSASVSELSDSLLNHPGLESLKQKADDLKAEADKHYKAANDKAMKAAAAAKAGAAGVQAKAQAKVDGVKDAGSDVYNRASLHTAGVTEDVKHAVNEATEAVRHAAVETSEAVRHKAAGVQNAAQQKVQDVKDTYHNIKESIKEKIHL